MSRKSRVAPLVLAVALFALCSFALMRTSQSTQSPTPAAVEKTVAIDPIANISPTEQQELGKMTADLDALMSKTPAEVGMTPAEYDRYITLRSLAIAITRNKMAQK